MSCLFLHSINLLINFKRRVGYQSGNTTQVFIAISRALHDPRRRLDSFGISDYQALCSVLSFALACQFGGRVLPWRKKSRARIVTSAVLQMLLTVAAAVTAYNTDGTTFNLSRSNPSWHNAFGYATLALLSMSMGLQGVVGESLGTGVSTLLITTRRLKTDTAIAHRDSGSYFDLLPARGTTVAAEVL